MIPRGVCFSCFACLACLALSCCGRGTAARLQVRRALTGCDAANGHVRCRRKRLVPRPCAVGIQNERREVEIRIARKSGSARRHGGLHEVDQFAGGPVTPLGQEVGARQLRPFAPAEIGRMTRGAIGLVNRASCRGLVLRIRSGRTLLAQRANKITTPQAAAAIARIIRIFIMPLRTVLIRPPLRRRTPLRRESGN